MKAINATLEKPVEPRTYSRENMWTAKPAPPADSQLPPLTHILPCPQCGQQPTFHHQPAGVWHFGNTLLRTPGFWYAYCGNHDSYGLDYLGFGRTLRQAQHDWQMQVTGPSKPDMSQCGFCARPLPHGGWNDSSPIGNNPACLDCNNVLVILGRRNIWQDNACMFEERSHPMRGK